VTTAEESTASEAQTRHEFIAANTADEAYPIAPAVDDPTTQWSEDDDEDEDDEDDRDGHGQYGSSHHGAAPVDLDSHDQDDPHDAADEAGVRHDPQDDSDDPDPGVPGDQGQRDDPTAGPRRFDSRVAVGFAGVLVAAVVLAVVASTMFYGGGDTKVAVRQATVADPAVAVPPSQSPAPAEQLAIGDRPLPYSADASGSCPAGSTSAQTMAGADPRNAFVCVRDGIDGQVIDIDLSKTYVITAISLTPGWTGQDASGAAQWSQHRVVTTVQYAFNDTERTLITQDTKNVHGEAVIPVQRVLASKVRMLIRQTSRPPADAPTSAAASPDLLPGLPTPPTFAGDPFVAGTPNSDPVDHTFAVSSLKIIGHEPL